MADGSERLVVQVDGDLDGLRQNLARTRQELDLASRAGRSMGSSLTRAFSDAAFRGGKLSDVVRGLAQALSRTALNAALKPINSAVGGLFGRAFAFQKGGVLSHAMPVPFARGGVIAAPTAFALGRGRLGIAGEAGPEAILPLQRGADGRLGVRAEAGAGVNVTLNVAAPDAQSFLRSESQITAMLARAVSRGGRNL